MEKVWVGSRVTLVFLGIFWEFFFYARKIVPIILCTLPVCPQQMSACVACCVCELMCMTHGVRITVACSTDMWVISCLSS
jgi:hypothetical protein